MDTTAEPQPSQLSGSQPIATQNSPVAYGLGSFGLYTLYTVFSGFYGFYYTDVLGLAVTMAAIHRQEGIYTSLLRVMGKLSMILDALALMLMGLLFGYASGENPGLQPEYAFRFLMSVFPLVFTIVAWLIASRLSFENEQA